MHSGFGNDTVQLSLLSACKYSQQHPLCLLHQEGSLEDVYLKQESCPYTCGCWNLV